MGRITVLENTSSVFPKLETSAAFSLLILITYLSITTPQDAHKRLVYIGLNTLEFSAIRR